MLRNVSNVTGVRSNVDLGSAVLLLGGPSGWRDRALSRVTSLPFVAILFSLRRDRELSYVVTLCATLLMAPLLWDHYLTNLIVPAAFLACAARRGACCCRCWRGCPCPGIPIGRCAASPTACFPSWPWSRCCCPSSRLIAGEPAGTFLDELRDWRRYAAGASLT